MTYDTKMQINLGLIAAIAIAAVVLGIHSLNNPPLVKYKLPSGEVVECREISQSNSSPVTLRDCKDGQEYLAQVNLTRIRESK